MDEKRHYIADCAGFCVLARCASNCCIDTIGVARTVGGHRGLL